MNFQRLPKHLLGKHQVAPAAATAGTATVFGTNLTLSDHPQMFLLTHTLFQNFDQIHQDGISFPSPDTLSWTSVLEIAQKITNEGINKSVFNISTTDSLARFTLFTKDN